MSIADSPILNSYERQYVSGNWTGSGGISLAGLIVVEKINQQAQITINATTVTNAIAVATYLEFDELLPTEFRPEVDLYIPITVVSGTSLTPRYVMGSIRISITGGLHVGLTLNNSNFLLEDQTFPVGQFIGLGNTVVPYSLNF